MAKGLGRRSSEQLALSADACPQQPKVPVVASPPLPYNVADGTAFLDIDAQLFSRILYIYQSGWNVPLHPRGEQMAGEFGWCRVSSAIRCRPRRDVTDGLADASRLGDGKQSNADLCRRWSRA
jgi:hypothetical protein